MSNPKPYKITLIDNIIVISFLSKLEAENWLKKYLEVKPNEVAKG